MGAQIMNSFWSLRWKAYTAVKTEPNARKILAWDVGRLVVWVVFFVVGLAIHETIIEAANRATALRLMTAVSTFGTFLASFVLAVMNATGKRELGLMRDAASVRQMEERLRWLLSDQLIMVISALGAAVFGLTWLATAAVAASPLLVLTGSVLAFAGLAVVNALRLPFQMWELQSSALADERERAYQRLNEETERRFRE